MHPARRPNSNQINERKENSTCVLSGHANTPFLQLHDAALRFCQQHVSVFHACCSAVQAKESSMGEHLQSWLCNQVSDPLLHPVKASLPGECGWLKQPGRWALRPLGQ